MTFRDVDIANSYDFCCWHIAANSDAAPARADEALR